MSKHFGRRSLLKTAGISATGLTAMTGSVIASSDPTFDQRVQHGDSVGVIDSVTQVGKTSDGSTLVTVKIEETDRRTGEVSYHTSAVKVQPGTGGISHTSLEREQFETLESVSTQDGASIQDHLDLPEFDQLIKKKDHYLGQNIGDCDAFNHQHTQDGLTMWFYQDIGKIGVGTVLTALGGYIGSLGGKALAAVGAGGGYLSTNLLERYVSTHTLSLVAWEYDVSEFGWNQTMFAVDISGHWHQNDPSHMYTVSTTAGHPSCDNCGFGLD